MHHGSDGIPNKIKTLTAHAYDMTQERHTSCTPEDHEADGQQYLPSGEVLPSAGSFQA